MGRRLVKLSAGTDANRLVEGEQEFVYLPTATKIGTYAFYHDVALINIFMPYVTVLSNTAFYGCHNLALTELPRGVTEIGLEAFAFCSNLALTALPSSVKTIDYGAFAHCNNLALTELPSGLTSIGRYAFGGCTSLTAITFKGTPTSIGSNVFDDCTNLTTINVPWAEGTFAEAEAAKFGAENATINFNYTEE